MIVAFDTSLRRTGWVRGFPGGPVEIGSFRIANASKMHIGRLQYEFAEMAWPLIDGCSHVYFEAPIMPRFHTNFGTQRRLYALTAHVEFLAFHARARAVEVENAKHKKLIYDHGGATPINAVNYAKAWGLPARNEDEADACGVFLYGLKCDFRDEFNQWFTIRRDHPPISRIAHPNKRKRTAPAKRRNVKAARGELSLFDEG